MQLSVFWTKLPNNFFLAFHQKSSMATPKLISQLNAMARHISLVTFD